MSNDKKNNFEGFEEVIELLREESQKNAKSDPKIDKRRPDDNYELYGYLENEAKRLEKVHLLITDKLKNLKESPQYEKLIETLLDRRTTIKTQLTFKFDENSVFYKEIANIFNQAFQEKSK